VAVVRRATSCRAPLFGRCAALLVALAVTAGLGACGADDELSPDIPRTSPDLTIPASTTDIPETGTTTSPATTTSPTGPDAGTTPPAAVAPPPVAPTPITPPPSSTTGGAVPPTRGQSTLDTGGAQPDDGEFQNFCRDNPGAGPPC
jgi:hypothetical protein